MGQVNYGRLWLGLQYFLNLNISFRATNLALHAFVLPMEGSTQNISSTRPKLQGYDFYREVLGSPKYVLAPMVDQSELVRAFTLQRSLVLIGNHRHGGHCPDDMVHK